MSESRSVDRRGAGWISAWVTSILTLSAAITTGYWVVQAVGAEDTEALESPLMLSVARQLIAGPSGLYGPFGGDNPLVLIHAPLYYRAAALAAWPMTHAGFDRVTAARIAGRSLSALGFLATLAAAYHLAILGGLPGRAGWWAVLLIAASPILDGQPVAVRPDMAGVALQTLGVLLVLARLRGDRPRGPGLVGAYAAFALAVCIKQHFVAAAGLSTGLLISAWWRGRVALREIQQGLLISAGIVAAVYGLEWLGTGGRIWEAAVVAAGSVGRVHPADWGHVQVMFVGLLNRLSGSIALLAAAGLSAVGAGSSLGRKLMVLLGTGAIGWVVGLLVVHPALPRSMIGALVVIGTFGILTVIVPACAVIERSRFLGSRLDAALWLYLAGEVALFTALFRINTGTWSNYAIQALVLAGVLTARALSRALELAPTRRVVLPVGLAAVGVLAMAADAVLGHLVRVRGDRAAVAAIVAWARRDRPTRELFFADRPGLNRLYGRLDLVYDDWLYPVFESLRLAEPRARWLADALGSGAVRVVVKSSPTPRIEGIEPALYALGYHPDIHVGPFYVWTR